MELIGLIMTLIFGCMFIFVIFLLIITILSRKYWLKNDQKNVSLALIIVTLLFGISGSFSLLEQNIYGLIAYGVALIFTFLTMFLRRSNMTVLFLSIGSLLLVVFSILFASILNANILEFSKDISIVGISYLIVAVFLSSSVLSVLAFISKNKTMSKVGVNIALLILVLVICLGGVADLLRHKSLTSGKRNDIRISPTNELVPFARDKSLYVVGTVDHNERKIINLDGTILASKVSQDNKYLVYLTNNDEYSGYSHKITHCFLINIDSGKKTELVLPQNANLDSIDISSDHNIAISYHTISKSNDIYSEGKYTYLNSIFNPDGKEIKRFEDSFLTISFVGRNLYVVQTNFDEFGSSQSSSIYKIDFSQYGLSKVEKNTVVKQIEFSSIKFDKLNNKITYLSPDVKYIYTLDLTTNNIEKYDISHATNKYTINVSRDGKYFTSGSTESFNNFMFSSQNKNYKRIIPYMTSGIWTASSDGIILKTEKGIVLRLINGQEITLTASRSDQLLMYF